MEQNAKSADSEKNASRKARLSPELDELLHMLGSLERQYADPPAAPGN